MNNTTRDSQPAGRFVTVVLPALAAAVLTLLLQGCSSEAQTQAAAPLPQVSVAAALERDVQEWDEFTGRLEAVESVEIRPRVTGYIESVNFTEGSIVKKGELLFVIDPRPYRADLSKAEAELARAVARAELSNTDVVRSEKLLGVKAVSREEYDQRLNAQRESQANVEAARAAVTAAKLNLEFTRVTAPITGRVSRAVVTAGNLVTGGSTQATLLTTLVSIDPIYVTFEGDEQVYLKYTELARRGDRPSSRDAANPVLMALANEQGFPHKGAMTFVDNQVDPRTGTIRARASFENKDGYLTPGLFARVKLLGHSSHKTVLVDDRAIGTDQSQKFVYVVDGENKVSYRSVKVGRLTDGLRIVEDGLAPGENVVVNGLQRVHPGVIVAPEKVAMDARLNDNAMLASTKP
ncbi:resistance-nodulation-cell division (RND) multidrug efflux membrane fusion protein MexE [Steroidobacter agaridevorans]|uniref:Resistance-nodulation-cell division (RND) multidrug efflux membrane fusion protein MexE n=1 Tax=Steroidobacter agaridevorans TaxID=2695856 RepID=A0A829Y500_9GAMM|nr:efflux RND transporter periplasmic adaptor subunit [Steroidobacter agaridevorans]GFE78209.1 resistance-nodulation-cell division (RND) multidrug efflux membrane fusion protein MexE [Steroidobacter agaridevorans]GFE91267.1 resistance-nodulation-cell division (RND) multidrug efflux membrane fusion protein MexE [Steroidobacter agaridevorans]